MKEGKINMRGLGIIMGLLGGIISGVLILAVPYAASQYVGVYQTNIQEHSNFLQNRPTIFIEKETLKKINSQIDSCGRSIEGAYCLVGNTKNDLYYITDAVKPECGTQGHTDINCTGFFGMTHSHPGTWVIDETRYFDLGSTNLTILPTLGNIAPSGGDRWVANITNLQLFGVIGWEDNCMLPVLPHACENETYGGKVHRFYIRINDSFYGQKWVCSDC